MDEILTAEDGAHGRSLEDVNMSFSQSFSPSRPLQIFLVSDHMKGRREEWRIEGLRKELKAEVMVVSFNFLLSNSSRVLPRSEDEGKKKNLTKQLKKIKGRREEWRIKVVGCQLQILVEHFLKNLVEVSVSPLCVMNDCDGCRVFARS
ncbi:hypothetical protein CFC21_041493 [Triticum aestivum]|uniref:Uncharacterized protein n=2 Tax=Triticum aestivum TaxID=4565 RepID=A0A9R1JU94_WHEAT|nr:hypothetical protein CFC21_041493 [Triticum aestivum]